MAVALIIIYNHRYDRNIELLERIYRPRFSHIYHLIPFYDGDKDNVIPVYDNSFYFQGYIAHGFRHFFRNDYTHYFFIADDMILNPVINENNYAKWFALDENSCFITDLYNIPTSGYWSHNRSAAHFNPFNKRAFKTNGVEVSGILPSKEEALNRMEALSIKGKGVVYPNNAYGNFFNQWRYKAKCLLEDIFIYRTFYPKKLNYPLVGSYSDIFIISSSSIALFSHLCGIFSATRLFVELAIPTAIALSAKKTTLEKDIQLQGRALWTKEDFEILDIYNNNLSLLLKEFPKKYIYLHPIKLSKWNTENI